MIGFFVRFIGLWIWAGAVVAAIYDGTKSLAASEFVMTPLGQTWYALHPNSLNGLQVFIERHMAEFLFTNVGDWAGELGLKLWYPVMQDYVLLAPTWAVAWPSTSRDPGSVGRARWIMLRSDCASRNASSANAWSPSSPRNIP